MRLIVLLMVVLLSLSAGVAMAESIDREISDLKADVASLNHELFELEEEILHPANTQVAVYLSFSARDYFVLDSVELSIDGHPAASHLYTERERMALEKGGVQRLYLGSLSVGEHTLSAVFNGQGANDHYHRKDASFTIEKASGKAQYELVLDAQAPAYEPKLQLKEWE
ncbi:AraC family transcriptional regulator [Marinobacter fonticola]|uniref:AraC family transcriptional regulator n=1 Tax=Marinobacter fonticola TaxID=2603215 RepID=UPI0011E72FF2|nr:AraC family transcriptional regulator [Marinobacter fonticola]